METMAFLGCSRGLGQQVCRDMDQRQLVSFSLLCGRSEMDLQSLSDSLNAPNEILTIDFSKPENLEILIVKIKKNKIQRLFYFAGGGPYGEFHKKSWKDHQWALDVTLLTPARLLHRVVSDPELNHVSQLVLVGSQIADSKADPMASSYAMAKHGLKGLVESFLAENSTFDLRLYRPGYMDTGLLPKKAKPRIEALPLLSVEEASKDLISGVMDPRMPKIWGSGA